MQDILGNNYTDTSHASPKLCYYISAPLLKLFEDKDVQARMMDAVETARIYYTSDDVTVNLVWSILILGVLLLCKYFRNSNQLNSVRSYGGHSTN